MTYVERTTEPLSRGTFLKLSAAGGAALALGKTGQIVIPDLTKRGLFSANGMFDATSIALADVIYLEAFPTSPLILSPFRDPLPIPKALAPVPKSIYSSLGEPARAGHRPAELDGQPGSTRSGQAGSAIPIRSSTGSTCR